MASRSHGPGNIDTVLASTLDKYEPTLVDNIITGVATFRILRELGQYELLSGGDMLVETIVKSTNATVKSMSKTDVLDTTVQDEVTDTAVTWRLYGETVTIPTQDIRNNKSDEVRIFNLLDGKMKIAEASMIYKLNQDLFNANSPATSIDALPNIVGTGTIGNIAGATYSYWQAQVLASGSFAVQGVKDMRTNFITASLGNDTPNLLITDKTTYGYYENSQQSLQRYIDVNKTFDAGAEALAFKNAAFIPDADCNSGYIYGLNLNYLKVRVHEDFNFAFSAPQEAFNQFVIAVKIGWQGNVQTNNRRMHFKNTGITA